MVQSSADILLRSSAMAAARSTGEKSCFCQRHSFPAPAEWGTLRFGFPRQLSTATLIKLWDEPGMLYTSKHRVPIREAKSCFSAVIILSILQAVGGICSCRWARHRKTVFHAMVELSIWKDPVTKYAHGIYTTANIKSWCCCHINCLLFFNTKLFSTK